MLTFASILKSIRYRGRFPHVHMAAMDHLQARVAGPRQGRRSAGAQAEPKKGEMVRRWDAERGVPVYEEA